MAPSIIVAMIASVQQELLGYDLSADQELLTIIALLFVFIGLFLAFSGRRIWRHLMSFIGAMIGGLLGFVFGAAVGGWLVGLVVGALCSIIGSALFIFLARVGISVVAALLSFIVLAMLTGNPAVALIVALVAFVMTFIYIEVAIGLVTAVVGGLLVGMGLLWLDLGMGVVVIGLLATMVLGAGFQMIALKEEVESRQVRASGVVQMPAPPAPPPMPGRVCARCGRQLSYIPEYNRYYCRHCQRYE